jgi:hypothetical protein
MPTSSSPKALIPTTQVPKVRKALLAKIFFLCLMLIQLTEAKNTTYLPFGKDAYLTSSFAESRGTRYHAGFDYSTDHELGWPILAPENGKVIRLRVSPWGYGKAVYFRGNSGVEWLYAHLSGFSEPIVKELKPYREKHELDKIDWRLKEGISFKKDDTLCYAGATGIGSPHLHLETRKSGKVWPPSKFKTQSGDSIKPRVLGIALVDTSDTEFNFSQSGSKYKTWSPQQKLWYSDSAAVSNGQYYSPFTKHYTGAKNLVMALKVVDYSRFPEENPMSIQSMEVLCQSSSGKKSIFKKKNKQLIYGKMKHIRQDFLWAEEAGEPGDWHFIGKGADANPMAEFHPNAFQVCLEKNSPLEVRLKDFNGNTDTTLLTATNSQTIALPPTHYQDSISFSFLSAYWIKLPLCSDSLNKSHKKFLYGIPGRKVKLELCAEKPEQQMFNPALYSITSLPESFTPRSHAGAPDVSVLTLLHPKTSQKKNSVFRSWKLFHPLYLDSTIKTQVPFPGEIPFPGKMRSSNDTNYVHITLQAKQFDMPIPTLVSVEGVNYLSQFSDSTGKAVPDTIGYRLEIHPKGLHLKGDLKACISSSDSLNKLFYLGETSRKWWSFSSQSVKADTSKNFASFVQHSYMHCASPNELRDLRFFVDTTAPILYEPAVWDSLAYNGKYQKALRIPLKDSLSDLGSFRAEVKDKEGKFLWIPSEYESEDKELYILKKDLCPDDPKKKLLKINLRLRVTDDFGNKDTLSLQSHCP